MDPLWSETCWSIFKYLKYCIITLIVFTNYIFVHLSGSNVFNRHWCTVQTWRNLYHVQGSSSTIPLKTVPIGCPEMSVTTNHRCVTSLKSDRPHLQCCGSLRSLKWRRCYWDVTNARVGHSRLRQQKCSIIIRCAVRQKGKAQLTCTYCKTRGAFNFAVMLTGYLREVLCAYLFCHEAYCVLLV